MATRIAIAIAILYSAIIFITSIIGYLTGEEADLFLISQDLFLSLCAIYYCAITYVLHSKVNKLNGMQVEKCEIYKQQLAFLFTLIFKVAVEYYETYVHLSRDSISEKTGFQLAIMQACTSILYKSMPLLYMLHTHGKTYRRGIFLHQTESEHQAANSDIRATIN